MTLFDRPLGIGIQLPVQSQSTRYVQDWEPDATPAELATIVLACEAAGFDYVAVCDHVAIPDDKVEAMSATWFDTIATLGWIAGMTERVHLLSHVYIAAYRHPLQVAKSWATLDHLSGGRAVLGVGVGHVEGEFAALGVPFGERGRRTDACLDGVAEIFATGRLDGCTVSPPPARPGGPPLWIGGSSPAALRRVARIGSGWLPQGTPYDEMPAAVDTIRAHQVELHGEERPLDVGVLTANLYVGDPGRDLRPGVFIGEPERLVRGLGRLPALGATHLMVGFEAASAGEFADQVARFGDECVPELTGG